MVEVLRFANVFFLALVAGTYTFEWVVVRSALRALPVERSAQFHDALFRELPNRYMPWAGAAGGLSTLALIGIGDQSETSTLLYVLGFVLMVTSAIATFGVSRRIDLGIGAIAAEPDPAIYGPLRERWDRLISLRAPLGVLGFACFVTAALTA